NVFLDYSDRENPAVKIGDFGLAQLVEFDQRLTPSGAVMGSPAYMSPEQARGEPVDARSDIYSFGCTMFKALTGRPPFEADTAIDTISARANREAPKLSQVKPELASLPRLEAIVEKALQRQLNLRYQTCDEVIQ